MVLGIRGSCCCADLLPCWGLNVSPSDAEGSDSTMRSKEKDDWQQKELKRGKTGQMKK